MTVDHWSKALHAVAVIATAAGTYLAGHKMAETGHEQQQVAHTQGVHQASDAVREAVRAEVRPLQVEMHRMGSAMDTLWAEARRVDGRLNALELPRDGTPAASTWRSLPASATR